MAQAPCEVVEPAGVDINDVHAILLARGQAAAPGDPRDPNGDGVITGRDARACVLKCANPRCAPIAP